MSTIQQFMPFFLTIRFAKFLGNGDQFTNEEIDEYYIDNEEEEEEEEVNLFEEDDSIEFDLTNVTAVSSQQRTQTFPLANGSASNVSSQVSRSNAKLLKRPPKDNNWTRGGWISEDERYENEEL